ncbi:RNA polymerase sigma factor [Thalassobaculum litoreum]|uniref:RNA polymerase sigma-70 factor, ECF subfamily n=1 Tax=Thalassobaculum litoreum DSM 18839 TaxID=1123362 RepID=A0A8G2BL77_9PROT|nr:RNA polymerase sigma factor [Thalassobaculum litoreum]SDF92919.1 RNA polymerase sigma-70 factor, ECF subfamily [Thalassobaculum litoreum DSM 18839]
MVTSSEILDHVHQLRRYARLLCGSPVGADDLVQATLEKAVRNAGRFVDGRNLRVWLFSIMHNTFRSTIRESRSRRDRETSWFAHAASTVAGGQEASVELSRVLGAIAQLPPQQREVLLLVSVEGFGTDEIALAMDIPVGTVRSRLARGREALRRLLEDDDSSVTPFTVVGGRDVH